MDDIKRTTFIMRPEYYAIVQDVCAHDNRSIQAEIEYLFSLRYEEIANKIRQQLKVKAWKE